VASLFGTDGVRGVANTELTPELALAVGRAVAASLPGERGSVVVGRDTRPSGDLLELAFSSGLLSAGAHALRCGILPTPAVAFLAPNLGAGAGAVLSASHNPVPDNGIKLFGPDGYKFTDEEQERVEVLLDRKLPRPTGSEVGRAAFVEDARERYIRHVLGALEGARLDGLKVVVDCAYGAGFETTPEALSRAGADVVALNASPKGDLINVACGSNAPQVVAAAVRTHGAHVGLAHDGDADRVIAVDEAGSVVDGDAMIALLALELRDEGRLPGNAVVTTVMANLGFRLAMAAEGIHVIETEVGDRAVIGAMRRNGAALGGEQSGHVIFADHGTTGDGLVTGMRVLRRVAASGLPLSELASVVQRAPQVLLNVPVTDRSLLAEAEPLWKAVSAAQALLGGSGRVLVRASGTEPLVRVMVEATEEGMARGVAEELAEIVVRELGTTPGKGATQA
jgi:phosphoglucosamine mutase